MISEVEAKFSVPDSETFRRLKSLETLAGFELSKGRLVAVHDSFLDTAGRKLSSAGYVLRIRESGGKAFATLKGKGKIKGAIHEREELECEIPGVRTPLAEWPKSKVREKLLSLTGNSPLLPLFEQMQSRFVRAIEKEGREIAELSLDEVSVAGKTGALNYSEIEAELKPEGTRADLKRIAEALISEHRLSPEPCSKFARGQEFASRE